MQVQICVRQSNIHVYFLDRNVEIYYAYLYHMINDWISLFSSFLTMYIAVKYNP